MNGMTWADAGDGPNKERGLIMAWMDDGVARHLSFELPAGTGDLSDDRYLSFRAAQTARHPATTTTRDYASFTVTLVDELGVEASIDFGHYGKLPTPYPRTDSGTGNGWANEFQTVRIPLHAFEVDGTGLDLSAITAVRFDVGPGLGTLQGHIGLDDLEILP
jgi:hypothetical protein